MYLGAFTVGDQLLWGAAEPLRRMLRILLRALTGSRRDRGRHDICGVMLFARSFGDCAAGARRLRMFYAHAAVQPRPHRGLATVATRMQQGAQLHRRTLLGGDVHKML